MLLLGQRFVYGLAFGRHHRVVLRSWPRRSPCSRPCSGFAGTKIDRLSIRLPAPGRRPGPHTATRSGSGGAASSSAVRGPRPSGRSPCCSCWRYRCSRCSMLVSRLGQRPTTQTTRHAYDLLPTGFGAGFNGPLVVAGCRAGCDHGQDGHHRGRRQGGHRAAGHPGHRRRRTAAGDRQRPRRRRGGHPDHLAAERQDRRAGPRPAPARDPWGDDRHRRARAGGRVHRRRHRRRRQLLATGSSGSSAAWCCCRSCC